MAPWICFGVSKRYAAIPCRSMLLLPPEDEKAYATEQGKEQHTTDHDPCYCASAERLWRRLR